MNNKINKSCTQDEYVIFVNFCNSKNLRIEASDNYYYGLEDFEKLDGDSIINIKDSEEYVNSKNALKIENIKDILIELDNKSLRAIRTILASSDNPPEEDLKILKEYEKQAELLRQNIQTLENVTELK